MDDGYYCFFCTGEKIFSEGTVSEEILKGILRIIIERGENENGNNGNKRKSRKNHGNHRYGNK